MKLIKLQKPRLFLRLYHYYVSGRWSMQPASLLNNSYYSPWCINCIHIKTNALQACIFVAKERAKATFNLNHRRKVVGLFWLQELLNFFLENHSDLDRGKEMRKGTVINQQTYAESKIKNLLAVLDKRDCLISKFILVCYFTMCKSVLSILLPWESWFR